MTQFPFWLTNSNGENSRGEAGGRIPIILALKRQMQEDCHKLKATLVYRVSARSIVRPYWRGSVGQK